MSDITAKAASPAPIVRRCVVCDEFACYGFLPPLTSSEVWACPAHAKEVREQHKVPAPPR